MFSHRKPKLATAMLALLFIGGLAFSACADEVVEFPTTIPQPISEPEKLIVVPPISGVFDYQLGGDYEAVFVAGFPTPVTVVARDSTSIPLSGAYNICYVNGFQTQPQDAPLWLANTDLLLQNASGKPVVDPDWPDEYILNPGNSNKIAGILEIVGPIIQSCAGKGFDAVEIDNLDTFTRFKGISKDSVFALASEYVELAHSLGLAIGQKNTAEYSEELQKSLGFDFAVVESCTAWNECGDYTRVYGTQVLHIEYPTELEDAGLKFADACAALNRGPLMILRDLDLVASNEISYIYEQCS